VTIKGALATSVQHAHEPRSTGGSGIEVDVSWVSLCQPGSCAMEQMRLQYNVPEASECKYYPIQASVRAELQRVGLLPPLHLQSRAARAASGAPASSSNWGRRHTSGRRWNMTFIDAHQINISVRELLVDAIKPFFSPLIFPVRPGIDTCHRHVWQSAKKKASIKSPQDHNTLQHRHRPSIVSQPLRAIINPNIFLFRDPLVSEGANNARSRYVFCETSRHKC
jgi:hypothetical protein